jgi:bifunctional NMN adenylyltransferase/nudix hydrolase
MLQTKEEEIVIGGIGALVGRFQVPELHDGHKELLNTVKSRHDKVIVLLGLSPLKASKNNPLNFQARKKMIEDFDPEIECHYIEDQPSDQDWSNTLDSILSKHVPFDEKVILYGCRDSFMSHYHGKHDTKELLSRSVISGTEVRRRAKLNISDSKDFRKGVIWATGNQYPTAYPTVDVAILDEAGENVLLGKKRNQDKLVFIGGFVDPSKSGSNALEKNARREVMEETGIEVSTPEYVGSFFVEDWRYRSEKDNIITTFFKAKHVYGRPEPADDIYELKWVKLEDLVDLVMPWHIPLVEKLLENLGFSNDSGLTK